MLKKARDSGSLSSVIRERRECIFVAVDFFIQLHTKQHNVLHIILFAPPPPSKKLMWNSAYFLETVAYRRHLVQLERKNLISYNQSSRLLRSRSQSLLHVPRIKTDFGHRAFSSTDCSTNLEPHISTAVRVSPSLDSFKRHLKTHYRYFASP